MTKTELSKIIMDYGDFRVEANTLDELRNYETELVNRLYEAINYNRCSTQLLCVEKGDDNGITRGYQYKCINQDKDHYKIIDNYGYENWFLKEYFTITK